MACDSPHPTIGDLLCWHGPGHKGKHGNGAEEWADPMPAVAGDDSVCPKRSGGMGCIFGNGACERCGRPFVPPTSLDASCFENTCRLGANWHRRRDCQLPSAPSPAAVVECTGVAALWCPRCGSCTCSRGVGLLPLDSPDCPLHNARSAHAEPPTLLDEPAQTPSAPTGEAIGCSCSEKAPPCMAYWQSVLAGADRCSVCWHPRRCHRRSIAPAAKPSIDAVVDKHATLLVMYLMALPHGADQAPAIKAALRACALEAAR